MNRPRRSPGVAEPARTPPPGPRDLLPAAAIVVAQSLVWTVPGASPALARIFALGSPGLTGGAAAVLVTALSTGLAAGALAARRIAPGWALGGALAAALLAACSGGSAVGWPFALAVALHSLAVHRTAGLAAAGAAVTSLAAAGAVAVAGAAPRTAAGACLLAAGGTAMLWVLGRSRRRGRAGRSALAAYRAGAPAVPRFAAGAERERLMAELHDVAAHRLTGIVVAAGAATRLADPGLAAEATRHAAGAAREAVAELDRLIEAAGTVALDDIDALVAEHPGVDYRRTAAAAPPDVVAAAHRVVREALTNAVRYASGARLVRVEGTDATLTVTVTDMGGPPAAPGLGTGHGLAGLRSATRALGGSFAAGPDGPGWTVRAEFPLAAAPGSVPERRDDRPRASLAAFLKAPGGWRGPAALDAVLVVLAIALSLGAALPPGDDPDAFSSPLLGTSLALLFAVHSFPLWWRRRAPRGALTIALAALVGWLGLDLAGWPGPPLSDGFLWYWWVELALVYAVAAFRPGGRTWPAPLAVAAVGGAALASGDGITGNRAAAWAVLAAALAVPCFAVRALGAHTAARRRRRDAAAARDRDRLDREVCAAAAAERRRIADGLRRTARRHTRNAADEADAGRLDGVLAEAKAGLAALRELLSDLRARDDGGDPPPTVDGIAALAGRRGAAVRFAGERRPLPPALEVAAYQVAREMLGGGDAVTVAFSEQGVTVSGRVPDGAAAERRLRALTDACGGTLTIADDGAARGWLPEVSRP
ncbi:sensor histidine kinase [Actinomadura chibensis]|uniref:histidine kinase n=1 Tax=Actinomadura chibensis TaxID=392828 RepID=A0A5D0ND72_9ACTN|nr:histidine kinase [Actinomadura chibensis]TYB42165.1 sensor histidine kinase [Actinomadura chibensis]